MSTTVVAGREVNIGEPSFDDGNVVLVTVDNPTAFRLHRGVLARHSDVFRDMFEVVSPSDEGQEPQAVPMYDHPADLSSLVKTLYDGVASDPSDPLDFFQLAGTLRLANKYFATRIRTQVIQALLKTWPSTLEAHDEMVSTAVNAPIIRDMTYPYVHPLHLLSLANETNSPILKPSALYFLSVYQLSELIAGDHPKLATKHPSRPSSALSPEDIRDYTLMYQHRTAAILDFIRTFCQQYASSPTCGRDSCGRHMAHLTGRLQRVWQPKTAVLYFIYQVILEVQSTSSSSLCGTCRSSFVRKAQELRAEIWETLPSVIGLKSWAHLEATLSV